MKHFSLAQLKHELLESSDAKDAEFLKRFFKTGPGEYGEGDQFRGIRVPVLRKLATKYQSLSSSDSTELLHSSYHEDRMVALLIWLQQSKCADTDARLAIFTHYIDNCEYVNNWDLVDVSAPHLLGPFLASHTKIFEEFVVSQNVWQRRMAILASFYAIRKNDFRYSIAFAHQLVRDPHDLMHKAVGWMLREIGKRDLHTEEMFLKTYYHSMPRTMLRYAIEKFPEKRRQAYLKGLVEQ